MTPLLWDSSALGKRYTLESGSEAVDLLFTETALVQMVTTFTAYAETYSVLLRKRNRGSISAVTFHAAISLMQTEVIDGEDFNLLSIDDNDVLEGIAMMRRHNINAADAAILTVFLRYAQDCKQQNLTCIFIAADQRLLRAAEAEGLTAINPETLSAEDVARLLATF